MTPVTTGDGLRQQELMAFLESVGIKANIVPYPAHNTVEEGRALRGEMPGTFTKNLLLKDKKGRLFLIVAQEDRSIDLRTLHNKIGARGRLGFAPMETVREGPRGRAWSTHAACALTRWRSCNHCCARRKDNE